MLNKIINKVDAAKPEKKVSRLVFLDAIRGIGALVVLFSHSFYLFIPNFNDEHNEYFNFGQMGVAAFFLVSGFIIPFSIEKYKSVKVFLINRCFRIYPLYLVVFILSAILFRFNIEGEWLSIKGKILKNLLVHIFFIQDYLPNKKFDIVGLVPGAWTLFLEMVWYIIFSVIYAFDINRKNSLLLITANLFLLSLSIASIYINLRIPMGRPVLLFCCFVGLYIYRYFNKEVDISTFIKIMVISITNIFFALYVGFGIYTNPTFSLTCVLLSYTAGFTLFAFFFITNGQITGKIQGLFAFLGRISYSLYLIHGLVISIVGHYIGGTSFVNLGIVLLLSIPLSYCLYKFVEMPAIDLGKKFLNSMN